MKFTETHEWVELTEGIATVGVSDHAQSELGEIVHVELPKVGKTVKMGEEAAVLESTKAAADVYSPLSGTIIEVNTRLNEASDLINKSPEKDGWIFKVKPSQPLETSKLLDRETYAATFK